MNITVAIITAMRICMVYGDEGCKVPMGMAPPLSILCAPNHIMAAMEMLTMSISSGMVMATILLIFKAVVVRSRLASSNRASS